MQQQIITLLQVSKNEYEVTIISNYMAWCRKHEHSNIQAQRMLTSQALFNWWLQEYRKLEAKFIDIATPYKGYLSKEDMQRLHKQETMHIHNLFSKPLLYTTLNKRQEINGNPLAN